MRGEGADGPVVAEMPSNTGGAKRRDNPAEETGQPAMGGAENRFALVPSLGKTRDRLCLL
jgi:hypothetical protein